METRWWGTNVGALIAVLVIIGAFVLWLTGKLSPVQTIFLIALGFARLF